MHSIHQSTIFDKAKPIARWGRKAMGLVYRDSRAAYIYRLRASGFLGEETAVRGGTAIGRPHLITIREVEKLREHVEIMLFYEEDV